MKNKIRIIGGKWRSRQLPFIDSKGLRPTPARVRETLFNWLQYDIYDSRCLDLFAGSGALGVEAVSRGASKVIQVEKNTAACHLLKNNLTLLDAREISVVCGDVFGFLAGTSEKFDLVFLDPPFGQNMALQSCQCLEDNNWLASEAKIYVEVESSMRLPDVPANWLMLKSGRAGEVGYHLYQRSEVTGA